MVCVPSGLQKFLPFFFSPPPLLLLLAGCGMDKLKLRGVKECTEGFSAPKSPKQAIYRLRINIPYFAANYVLVLAIAFLIAFFILSRALLVSPAAAGVLAHALLKNPNVGASIKDFVAGGVGGTVKKMFK
jgi:hypothetical protein